MSAWVETSLFIGGPLDGQRREIAGRPARVTHVERVPRTRADDDGTLASVGLVDGPSVIYTRVPLALGPEDDFAVYITGLDGFTADDRARLTLLRLVAGYRRRRAD